MKASFPIDAVVAWVDGNDPIHRAKRMRYSRPEEADNDDIGGEVRYTNVGEIFYCVASILRFAPWIRYIHIVTDGQDPDLGPFVEKYFPDRKDDIKIVDHSQIFSGYEEVLPVFNSLSIESMLWRIPGLSERFVYFNDDIVLLRPLRQEDFFTERGIVCYASHMNLCVAKLLRQLKHLGSRHKVFGFKDAMINAADTCGQKHHIIHFGHTPHPQHRGFLEAFYLANKEALVSNIRHRFREPNQHNPQELCYLLAESEGQLEMRSLSGESLFLSPKAKRGYVDRKLKEFEASPDAKFCCINSLTDTSLEEQAKVLSWIKYRIGLSD